MREGSEIMMVPEEARCYCCEERPLEEGRPLLRGLNSPARVRAGETER